MVIAAFANDPQVKRQVLEPLLTSPHPPIRGRAAVELARVALREGDPDAAQAALDAAAGLALAPACEADVHYLRGRVALHRGETQAALDALATATGAGPRLLDAWRDQVPLLVGVLHESPRRTTDCLRHARRLIEILGLLPQLANDAGQFGKLALMLDRLGSHSSATLLASALMCNGPDRTPMAGAVLQRAMRTPVLLPAACEREIRARIAIGLEDAMTTDAASSRYSAWPPASPGWCAGHLRGAAFAFQAPPDVVAPEPVSGALRPLTSLLLGLSFLSPCRRRRALARTGRLRGFRAPPPAAAWGALWVCALLLVIECRRRGSPAPGDACGSGSLPRGWGCWPSVSASSCG